VLNLGEKAVVTTKTVDNPNVYELILDKAQYHKEGTWTATITTRPPTEVEGKWRSFTFIKIHSMKEVP